METRTNIDKKDINSFIAHMCMKYGEDNVEVSRAEDFEHIHTIITPKSTMVIYVMQYKKMVDGELVQGDEIGFAGTHTRGMFDMKSATNGDRDAKTLTFWINRELTVEV